VTDRSPAAVAAARAIAAGDLADAVETLERNAGAASGDSAAERWRRLGDLVAGIDTTKARVAYEKAFKLHAKLGQVLLKTGRRAEALAILRRGRDIILPLAGRAGPLWKQYVADFNNVISALER
jgi:hypothetical protein